MDGGFGWPNKNDHSQPWGHYQDTSQDTISICEPDHEYELGELIAPAGDIHVSVPDYVKFLQTNLRGIAGKDDLLKARTISYLHSANLPNSRYQIGWGVISKELNGRNLTFSSHDGSGGTYYVTTLLIHELGVGIVVATNIAGEQQEIGIKKIRNEIVRHVVKSLEVNAHVVSGQ